MKTTTHRKILALVLVCTMILTLMPALPVAAEEIIGVPTEPTLSTAENETNALAAAPVSDLTADCAILNYVDAEVFASGNHVLH